MLEIPPGKGSGFNYQLLTFFCTIPGKLAIGLRGLLKSNNKNVQHSSISAARILYCMCMLWMHNHFFFFLLFMQQPRIAGGDTIGSQPAIHPFIWHSSHREYGVKAFSSAVSICCLSGCWLGLPCFIVGIVLAKMVDQIE